MTGYPIRRTPWTCRWGRFGVAIEDLGSTWKVDEKFWACHNPDRGPDVEVTKRAECEHCAFWRLAPRLRPQPQVW